MADVMGLIAMGGVLASLVLHQGSECCSLPILSAVSTLQGSSFQPQCLMHGQQCVSRVTVHAACLHLSVRGCSAALPCQLESHTSETCSFDSVAACRLAASMPGW